MSTQTISFESYSLATVEGTSNPNLVAVYDLQLAVRTAI